MLVETGVVDKPGVLCYNDGVDRAQDHPGRAQVMNSRSVATIRVEDVPATAQLAGAIDKAKSGLYVSSGSTIRFVALPVHDYEKMQHQQQRLLLREQFIRSLIEAGYSGPELQALLPAFDAADEAWLEDPAAARAQMIEQSQTAIHLYCREQGIDYEAMGEEEIDHLAQLAVKLARGTIDAQSSS